MLATTDPQSTPPKTGRLTLTGRRFLIVTAPFGPFAGRLANAIEARGGTVVRMIFNAGDLLSWRRSNGQVFRDGPDVWATRSVALTAGFSDLIIFGEGGPYNHAIVALEKSTGTRVWVLENGYFRPDWITLEQGGVNACSRLPRRRADYDDPVPEVVPPRSLGRILPYHVLNISLHHLVQVPGRILFPRYAPAYTAPAWLQCAGHIGRYLRGLVASRRACDAEEIAARGAYFLVCLQREGDTQLLRYSRLPDNAAFLAGIMTSFARFAPADARLVVKNHPLDPGLLDLRRVTRSLAVERGLASRVDFIDGGQLSDLCRRSRGLVVNNSSAALSALGFGTPVKVLGQAFFDFDGLTDQQPLDGFWTSPTAPDPDLFHRFRATVIARTQINGSFHAPAAINATAARLAEIFAGRGNPERNGT
ncbi:capsular biosynthesis protein [uncultured Brevundimonas sp.]|uniref:capsular biosynthesis protein n=1 Tax=uncultured Brevundimonas sp. TaxID=213418 RepID=UPI0030ED8306